MPPSWICWDFDSKNRFPDKTPAQNGLWKPSYIWISDSVCFSGSDATCAKRLWTFHHGEQGFFFLCHSGANVGRNKTQKKKKNPKKVRERDIQLWDDASELDFPLFTCGEIRWTLIIIWTSSDHHLNPTLSRRVQMNQLRFVVSCGVYSGTKSQKAVRNIPSSGLRERPAPRFFCVIRYFLMTLLYPASVDTHW